MSSGVLAEDLLFKDESYLPLSDLDLRVLVADLRASLERFRLKRPDAEIRRLIVTGVNSSHPLLADLLAEQLSIPVVTSHSTAVTGLVGLSMDDMLLRSGLGRLTGLALGLLPNNQLLACSLEDHASNGQASRHQNNAVAIADLLTSSEAQTGLDLVAVETSNVGDVAEETNTDQSILTITNTVEEVSALDLDIELKPDEEIDVVDQPDRSPISPKQSSDPDELLSDLPTVASFNEHVPDIVIDELPLDELSQDELPSISPSATEYKTDIKILDDAELSHEQWPSITTQDDCVGDDDQSLTESDVLDDSSVDPALLSSETVFDDDGSPSPTLWPSIDSAEMMDDVLVDEVAVKVEEPEWPSISTYSAQESFSSVLPDNPEILIQTEENFSEVADADLVLSESSSFEEPGVIDQSNAEGAQLGMLTIESTSDDASQAVISDLHLTSEGDEDHKESVTKPSVSKESDSTDVFEELGELRFADEN